MKMIKQVAKGSLMAGLLSALVPTVGQAADNNHPNIVYILADDLGYGDISYLNENSKITTPHLDQIASQGMVFTNAHTSSSVCTPTRYGILTGRYNWRSRLKKGVLGGYDKHLINTDRTTVADVAKKAGYNTACIGKWHLGMDWPVKPGTPAEKTPKGYNDYGVIDFKAKIKNGPNALGFDYYYGISASLDMPPYIYIENDKTEGVPTTIKAFHRKGLAHEDFEAIDVLPKIGEKSIEYIEKQSKKKPFFMYIPLSAPHTPILPTKEWQGKSGINKYTDFVLMVDDVVGKITEALKKKGFDKNTLFIFTSDNGCSPAARYHEILAKGHNPSYIFRGHKADIYEGGHRVPFIVRWPGTVAEGTACKQTICTTDLLATVAGITDVKIDDATGEDSYNMMPLLKQEKLDGDFREATIHHSIRGSFAIRKGAWKLVMCPGSGGWSYPRPGRNDNVIALMPKIQLFNIEADPGEQMNISDKFPKIVEEMQNLLTSYIEKGRSTPGTPQQNYEGKNNWEQLWWMKN
ncbi:arylsulfatase [Puteibacter caeruleilacunae]|nr:arylsulfatase [Puteibacter caeruleilacunae]